MDSGRAAGGPYASSTAGRWLSDVGVGMRIAIDRAARANVLHADIAVPLNRQGGVKSVQFLGADTDPTSASEARLRKF